MDGTPGTLATSEAHFGRRKSDAAAALADARLHRSAWRELVRTLCDRLEQAQLEFAWIDDARDASSHAALVRGSVAFVEPWLASCAEALALAMPRVPQGTAGRVRICTSLAPDAVRAALAGLSDLRESSVWIARGDPAREQLADSLNFQSVEFLGSPQRPAQDAVSSLFAPGALELAALRGADVLRLLSCARAFAVSLGDAADSSDETGPFALGALLAGMAARGAGQVHLSFPPALRALEHWIEFAAGLLPAESRIGIFGGEPLAQATAYGNDRWLIDCRFDAQTQTPALSARAHRLVAAGVPMLQLALPARDALVGELVRWDLALGFAAELTKSNWPRARLAHAASAFLTSLGEPALRQPPLSLFAAPAHAHVLRKVAGTLGTAAQGSVPHWLAAHLALAEPGDFVALHFSALGTEKNREALSSLQTALGAASRVPVRAMFSLPGRSPDDATPARLLDCAATSSRGLYLLLDDEDERTLVALASAGRRVVLLRAVDGEPTALFSTLGAAAELLAR